MKRVLFFGLLMCGLAAGANAQAVDTDVCAIVKNPTSFDGKIVRVKGIAVASYDSFVIKDANVCGFPVDGIWLEYPTGTKGKAGPAALVTAQPARNYAGPYKAPARTAVVLDKSKDFKTFDSLLSTPRKGMGLCPGCVKSTASATFVGRLDAVSSVKLKRDKDGKVTDFGGFGNMNAYPTRLVLQSVSDITPKDVDYSKQDAVYATPGQRGPGGPGGFGAPQTGLYDAVSAAQKLAEGMAGMPAADTVKKDVSMFPKSGEHNGVVITYNPSNELPKEEVSTKDAPDGVQYNVFINLDRLDQEGQKLTIIHAGHHISDLKAPAPGGEDAPMFVAEYNAWTMTVLGAAMDQQKTLGLSGGYLLWDGLWPEGERNDSIDKALRDFLANSALSQ